MEEHNIMAKIFTIMADGKKRCGVSHRLLVTNHRALSHKGLLLKVGKRPISQELKERQMISK